MFKFLIYALGIYCLILALLYVFQRSLIYFPDRTLYTPAQAGVPEMATIPLNTQDGLKISVWYRPPSEPNMPTILYLHGNAGNIADRAFIVHPFLRLGYGVLLLTYRGYSGNPGTPSEEGFYNDARAAIEFLKTEGVPDKCLVLYGNSIGAAVAVQMATEYQVGGIVLQSPFTSAIDVAKIHYAFFLPFEAALKDKYNSVSKADNVSAPALILHGKDDLIIPPELSRKLFERLPMPKEAEYIPGRGHNDLFEPSIVVRFLGKYVNCQAFKEPQ